MRIATQFSVFLINKPGVLAAVTGALAKAKINITALSLADSGEQGVLRVVADETDTENTRKVLSAAHDHYTETQVLVIELGNHPGAFADAAETLAREKVNILYAYSTGGAPGGRTSAVFKVNNAKKAGKALDIRERSGGGKSKDQTVKPSPKRRRG
ncbi:MAG: ACT domain-containing protein [Phycisphaerae bacterium]